MNSRFDSSIEPTDVRIVERTRQGNEYYDVEVLTGRARRAPEWETIIEWPTHFSYQRQNNDRERVNRDIRKMFLELSN